MTPGPAVRAEDGTATPDRRAQLVDTMLRIVAAQGLERLSVREVAAGADVSIGAVQHHFPTKDDMLVAAFEEVVDRTRRRIGGLALGPDRRANLELVLRELLPIDDARIAETRVHLAFAARAAVAPQLAVIQHRTLGAVQSELASVIAGYRRDERALPVSAADAARILLAVTDGLALHAVSAPGLIDARALPRLLGRSLDAVLGPRAAAARR